MIQLLAHTDRHSKTWPDNNYLLLKDTYSLCFRSILTIPVEALKPLNHTIVGASSSGTTGPRIWLAIPLVVGGTPFLRRYSEHKCHSYTGQHNAYYTPAPRKTVPTTLALLQSLQPAISTTLRGEMGVKVPLAGVGCHEDYSNAFTHLNSVRANGSNNETSTEGESVGAELVDPAWII